MSIWELYLLTRLEGLQAFFGILTIIGGMIGFLGTLHGVAQKSKRIILYGATVSILSLGSCFVTLLIPSNKDLAIIFAGHWATNNEEMKKLPDNVIKIVNGFLDEYNKEKK